MPYIYKMVLGKHSHFRWNSNMYTQWSKKFIVRDAIFSENFGTNSNEGTLIISEGSNLYIDALNRVDLHDSVIIDNGMLNFECDGIADISSISINREGNLYGRASQVTINPGFSMELGASLTLKTK